MPRTLRLSDSISKPTPAYDTRPSDGRYHHHVDRAAAFLASEADDRAPYMALGNLTDDDLARSVPDAHGWSGRDLMAHLVFWQEIAVRILRDLSSSDDSSTDAWASTEWDSRGDAWNEEILVEWRSKPLAEVRELFETTPGALRAALEAAPEARWWGNKEYRKTVVEETIEHYADHHSELAAILAAAEG